MADDQPQLCLVTPPAPDPARFPDELAAILDTVPVACLRLTLAGEDADAIARITDALREVAHARDVLVLIADHARLVQPLGLDGVHLSDGARRVRELRRKFGPDIAIGAHGGTTRHGGIAAAEAGADYISLGPVGASLLGDGTRAAPELFDWWSEVIEVPVIAEGALDAELMARLAPVTDFFALGAEIWNDADPLARLRQLAAAGGIG